jgi:hypothetical protein
MNKYYCSGCKQIVIRDSNEECFYNYCATKDKEVLIKKLKHDRSKRTGRRIN